MIKKFDKILDKYFKPYKKMDKVMEFREEMLDTINVAYEDYLKEGLSQEESYKKALETLDGIEEAIEEFVDEYCPSLKPEYIQRKIGDFALYTMLYSLIVLMVYAVWSFSTKKWDVTWITFIFGAYGYSLIGAFIAYKKFKVKSLDISSRIAAFSATTLIYSIFYIALSLYFNKWIYTLILIPVGLLNCNITDVIVRRNFSRKHKTLFFDLVFNTINISVIVYLAFSFYTKMWSNSWLIFIAMLIIVILEILVKRKKNM